MDDYLDVVINIFEHGAQHARVRRNITVAALIQVVLNQFDDIAGEAPEKYALYLKDSDRPLRSNFSMEKLDIQPHDELTFDYIHQPIKKMLEPGYYASLREELSGNTYSIQWQPAVIGRPTSDVSHNLILAVNLQTLPNSITVSHKHAQITFSEGHYFLEPLAENNPVLLNGKELPPGSQREIKSGDKIAIGKHRIGMTFEAQRDAAPTQIDALPQAAKMTPPTPKQVAPEKDSSQPEVASAVPAPGEAPAAYLVIETCTVVDNIGQKLVLEQYPFLLGRNLPLLSGEKEISHRHAEITYDPQARKFTITDLKSTNGVSVDGKPIEPEKPVEIKPGAKIGLGRIVTLRLKK